MTSEKALMSDREPSNYLPLLEAAAAPLDNNNGLMVNTTATFLGTTYSAFDCTKAQMAFVWELTGSDMKVVLRTQQACAPPVKDIEFFSDVKYKAQFSMSMDNGIGIVQAQIRREINFEKSFVTPSFHFFVNGTSKMYGSQIPREVIEDVMTKNGMISIVADLNTPEDDDFDSDEHENMQLPFDS